MFIESLNASTGYKVTQISMENPFWCNGMKAEAFCQLHHSHHPGTEPAVQNNSTQAKGTFDLLTLYKAKQF